MRSNRRRDHRCGMVLVETIGLISIVAAILSLSALILNRAFAAQQNALRVIQRSEQLQQFSDRWRADVRSAAEFRLDDAPHSLLLVFGGGRQVRYYQQASLVVREHLQADESAARDDWALPPEASIRWSAAPSQRLSLLSAQITFPAEQATPDLVWLAAAAKELVIDE